MICVTHRRVFVPPSSYESNAGAGTLWFGTDRLWTNLPANGTWRGLGHYTPEPQPNLKVTGRRLDAQAAPLMADRVNNVASEPAALVVGINFPTLGCWEITGRYRDDTLTFVVWVAK